MRVIRRACGAVGVACSHGLPGTSDFVQGHLVKSHEELHAAIEVYPSMASEVRDSRFETHSQARCCPDVLSALRGTRFR